MSEEAGLRYTTIDEFALTSPHAYAERLEADLLRRAHFELTYHWRPSSRAMAAEMRDALGPDPEEWR